MSDDDSKQHEVGYAKPPRQTRFRPGVSGNPSGRPKKPPNIRSELNRVLAQETSIHDGAREFRVSIRTAIARKIVELAMDGDPKAIALVMSHDDGVDDQILDGDSSEDDEIVKEFKARERQRNKTEGQQ